MANFSKVSVASDARVELHDLLSLTGAEVSVNHLPAGAGVPFVHAHKQNEEIYGILEGKGKVVIDRETVELAAGDWGADRSSCHAPVLCGSRYGHGLYLYPGEGAFPGRLYEG